MRLRAALTVGSQGGALNLRCLATGALREGLLPTSAGNLDAHEIEHQKRRFETAEIKNRCRWFPNIGTEKSPKPRGEGIGECAIFTLCASRQPFFFNQKKGRTAFGAPSRISFRDVRPSNATANDDRTSYFPAQKSDASAE